jgi:hypothetical protein
VSPSERSQAADAARNVLVSADELVSSDRLIEPLEGSAAGDGGKGSAHSGRPNRRDERGERAHRALSSR